ncbi:MAG: type II toxin-antitoxin system RelE/ParE family toxin [Elusimicrobia bacterium]|nr:type II toxin-antitoxin system RelE/ParE family toxin [Elusimicrobiota bacterium]
MVSERFKRWFACADDGPVRRAVLARLDRIQRGDFGDHRSVGGGVWELRIHLGPGIRVYFGRHAGRIVLLLGGGTKGSQAADIFRARSLWTALSARMT